MDSAANISPARFAFGKTQFESKIFNGVFVLPQLIIKHLGYY